MPLPEGGAKVQWPPARLERSYRHMAEHSAWYSGDSEQLAAVYGGSVALEPYFGAPPLSSMDTSRDRPWYRRFMFWSKRNTAIPSTRLRVHVPLASDIAMTSADLLFSEAPALQIAGAHVAKASRADKAAQTRLEELDELDQICQTLLEAAESSAAMSGVYFRVVWDKTFAARPLLTVVQADCAVPEFTWGELTAVTFWRRITQTGTSGSGTDKVFRHLERHEIGWVHHGLYEGDVHNLGHPVPLTAVPETAILYTEDKLTTSIETGLKMLTAVYVPNIKPNRLDRGSDLGRSDFQAIEGLMDSLDETYTSWIRDLRLGRARIIVPDEYVRSLGPTGQDKGKGATFDIEQEIFHPLPGLPPSEGTITQNQFLIRVQEHSDTARALIERAVSTAGYAYSTFGLPEATIAVTATEIAAREHRSLSTRGKKLKYWAKPIADILEVLLAIDNLVFAGPAPVRPNIIPAPGAPKDPLPQAHTIALLAQAEALSTDTKVRMLNPNWSDDQVKEEVTKILAMAKAAAPPAPVHIQPLPGAPVPPSPPAPPGGPNPAPAP